MSTTTQQQITDLQNKITAAESDARTSTEEDRSRLEQLQQQAVADAQAENTRQAARRLAWARHYLETTHTPEATQARKDTTAARREFETILAEQPWVQALLGWQGAINAEHAVASRAAHARRLIGVPATDPRPAANVLPMLDSEVAFTPIGRVLHWMADSLEQADPTAELDELAAATEGKDDPLTEAVSSKGVGKSDPLVWLARDGSRLDVALHDSGDGKVTMHRNPNTDEWVMTDAAGRVKTTSWQQAETQSRPSNPIDGSQFGSVMDPERKVFVKQRVN